VKIEENGQSVADFDYDRQGRVSDLKLPDGRHYRFRYDYDRADTKRIVRATLTAPDRSTAKFDFPPN
jgi:YD repeat-containing protein